jgi:lysophospholipase L1-like esterase
MNGGLLRPVSKTLTDTTIHPFASLAARPTASEFGIGHASIVTATYRINCSSDGVSWDSHGSSDSIADRPSAAALGKGSWQVGNSVEYSDGVAYVNPANTKQPTLVWDAAKAKASSGFGNAKVLFLGDSITAGAFATNGTSYANAKINATPAHIAAKMAANGFATSKSSWFGMQNQGTVAALATYDPRLSFGADWASINGTKSLGGDLVVNAASASTTALSFTPTEAFDTIDIYYVRNTSYGSFTVDIGAGVIATQSATGSTGVLVLSLTVASGLHTVNISHVAGTGSAAIVGMSCYTNNSEVQVINAGLPGALATTLFTGTGFSPEAAINTLNPDLTVINLTTNDAQALIATATAMASLQVIIDRCLLSGDVVLCVPNPVSSNVATAEEYYTAIRLLGSENSLNVFDYSTGLGVDWAVVNANGLMKDALHPKQAGYKAIADIAGSYGVLY